jgi:hypothetical protein
MKSTWKMAIPSVALLSALFAGCESAPPTPEPKPMIPSVIAGMNVPPDDVENVRYGEAVKQYRSGRYIDPNNTRVMYERNVVYKVEEDAAWNLRPNAALLRSNEPWNPDRPPRELDSQKALYAEMETQLKDVKRSSEAAAKAAETAQRANATSAETRATVQSQTATLAIAARTMNAVGDSIKELERRISELDAKTKALEASKRLQDSQRQAADAKQFNPDAPAPDEASEFNPKNKRDAK